MATIPPVNITEAPSAYQLSLAVPGLSKDDLAIRLDRNLLTVCAEKETKTENKEEKATRSEYNYSSFSRSFTLPEDVRQESITATYENGVLKLDLPRLEGQTNGSARDISIS